MNPMRSKCGDIRFLCLILAVTASALAYIAFTLPGGRELRVYFLDVGQGDASLVVTPGGRQVLIDGGPDGSVLARLGSVMPAWDRTIDMVIQTHPEKDHEAGLIDVLEAYAVTYIVETGLAKETAIDASWRTARDEEGARVIKAVAPMRIVLEEGVVLDIIWPQKTYDGETLERTNNAGIVGRLSYGGAQVLFTADIERKAEEELLASGFSVDADVVKIAHHGSKTSSGEMFLRAVDPDAAVISAGRDNSYGHPYEGTVRRLKRMNINIHRTDIEGIILMRTDGTNIRIGKVSAF